MQLGISTGCFFKIGTIKALETLQRSSDSINAIEISLRDKFLDLKDHIEKRDFSMFNNISFHIPKFKEISEDITEKEVVEMSIPFKQRGWNIVLHPNEIKDFPLWEEFGSQLCIENMDSSKPFGTTIEDMEIVFNKLPNASMCFDIGHAKQMDITMEMGKEMCSKFYDRIKIVHFSDVLPNCKHDSVTESTLKLFSPIMDMLPKDCSIIIEYNIPVRPIECEIKFLKNNIDIIKEE